MDELFADIDPSAFEAALRRDPPKPSPAEAAWQAAQMPRPAAAPQPTAPRAIDPQFLAALDRELFQPAVQSPPPVRASAPSPSNAIPAAPPQTAVSPAVDEFYDEDAPLFDSQASLKPAAPQPAAAMIKRGGRGLGTVIVVLGLVVVGLGTVAAASFLSWRSAKVTSGEPIVVRADPRPSRVVPAEQPQEANPSNKAIFDRLGQDSAAPKAEKIVPREEQPVAALPARPTSQPVSPPTQLSEPRRVTTTTIRVKPDGSLESEPTRRELADAKPASAVTTENGQAVALAGSPTAIDPSRGNPLPAPATTGRAQPVTVPTIAAAPSRPAPQPSPGLATPVVREVSAAPKEQAAPAGSFGGYMVQISSQRSREAAEASFADLVRRHSGLLSGQPHEVKEVDLGSKGTYYRVRIGPMQTRVEANEFCARFKAAGGSCVVSSS